MAFSPNPDVRRSTRGFASMAPEKQRAIAAKGGRAIAADKRSFSKDRDLAREAGRKGGLRGQLKETR